MAALKEAKKETAQGELISHEEAWADVLKENEADQQS